MVTAGAVLEKALEEGPDPFPQLKAPSKSKISRKRKVRTNKHDKGRGKGRSARKQCRCKVDPQKRLREFPNENFVVTGWLDSVPSPSCALAARRSYLALSLRRQYKKKATSVGALQY